MDTKDRRSFLKIGGGVVVGAAVAGVATIAYYNGVIGNNSSSSSSTVQSLSSQLATTQSQLSDTQSSLSNAQSTIGALNSQLSDTQSSLSNAQSSLSAANSQNAGLNSQLSSTQASLTSANGQISSLQSAVTSANGQVTSLQSQVTSLNSQASSLQGSVDSQAAFLTLNVTEQTELLAIASAIIPTDSTGPGATTAGVAYFIDHQLKGLYGHAGNVFMDSPHIPANTTGPITVNDFEGNPVTYTGATVTFNVGSTSYKVVYPATGNVRVGAGTRYQYLWDMREYWRLGLEGIETYATAAYGGAFETLSAANQTACLTDLWNNKPTLAQFNDILPSDFAYELFFMVWNGFGMDPVYGGNWNMVGWKYYGFNGVNMGNFFNEGLTTKEIMVMTKPVTLNPVSLGQFQKGSV